MKYAGFWIRFVAVLIDFAIMLLPVFVLNMALPYVGSVLVALFYYPVFECSPLMSTPGKYWMGLRVVSENGNALSFGQALGRHFMKYVSGLVLMIGYIMQVFTAKRQALHDLAAGAVVIDVRGQAVTGSPDWVQTWIRQMRYILQVDKQNPADLTVDVTSSSVSSSQMANADEKAGTTQTQSASQAVEAIEKLYELYKNGVLTEDEFQAKKSELLKQV